MSQCFPNGGSRIRFIHNMHFWVFGWFKIKLLFAHICRDWLNGFNKLIDGLKQILILNFHGYSVGRNNRRQSYRKLLFQNMYRNTRNFSLGHVVVVIRWSGLWKHWRADHKINHLTEGSLHTICVLATHIDSIYMEVLHSLANSVHLSNQIIYSFT